MQTMLRCKNTYSLKFQIRELSEILICEVKQGNMLPGLTYGTCKILIRVGTRDCGSKNAYVELNTRVAHRCLLLSLLNEMCCLFSY